MSKNDEQTKRMADLLKSGATMLFEHCPQCGSPLFKIQDEVWCTNCDKKVVIIKRSEEVPDTSTAILLSDIETTVLSKLQEINQRVRDETDVSNLEALGNLLSTWLEVYEKIKNIHKEKGKT